MKRVSIVSHPSLIILMLFIFKTNFVFSTTDTETRFNPTNKSFLISTNANELQNENTVPLVQKIELLNAEISKLKKVLSLAIENNSMNSAARNAVEQKIKAINNYISILRTKEGAVLFEKRSKIEKLANFSYPSDGKSIVNILEEYAPINELPKEYNDLLLQLLTKQAEIEKTFDENNREKLDKLNKEVLSISSQIRTWESKNKIKYNPTRLGLVQVKNDNKLPPYWITGNPDTDKQNYTQAKQQYIKDKEAEEKKQDEIKRKNVENPQ